MLGSMEKEELREAIEQPAAVFQVEFENGLTDKILAAIHKEPGNLPLVQFALTELWKTQRHRTLTHSAYDTIGGIEQAISVYAENVYKNLGSRAQHSARFVLTQLVHPGEGAEDTRRMATRSEIGEQHRDVVTTLADRRLVVTGGKAESGETVEIVHESLIVNWQRLRDWIDRDREFLTWRKRVRQALDNWKHSQKDDGALLRGAPLTEAEAWLAQKGEESTSEEERQFIQASQELRNREIRTRQKQRNRTIFVLATGLVLAVILLAFAGIQWQIAFQKTREAEKNADKALQQEQFAQEQRAKAEKSEEEARRQQAIAEENYKLSQIEKIKVLNQTANGLFYPGSDELKGLLTGIKAGKMVAERDVPLSLQFQVLFDVQKLVHGIHKKNQWQVDTNPVSVKISPDGSMLASASSGGYGSRVMLWRLADGKLLKRLPGEEIISFSPDGRFLAMLGEDHKSIRLWDINRDRELHVFYGHIGSITSFAFSSDGNILASGGGALDNTIRLWEVETGQALQVFQENSYIKSLSFHPNASMLASVTNDDTKISIWNLGTNQRIKRFYAHDQEISHVQFSSDGALLASASEEGEIKIWNANDEFSLKETLYTRSDKRFRTCIEFSPNGTLLATGDEYKGRGEVVIWDVTNGQQIQSLSTHSGEIANLDFGPDSRTLAIGQDDGIVELWDLADKGVLTELSTGYSFGRAKLDFHQDVDDMRFSPDGRLLISTEQEPALKILEVNNKRTPITLTGLSKHIDEADSLSISPNGKYMALGGSKIHPNPKRGFFEPDTVEEPKIILCELVEIEGNLIANNVQTLSKFIHKNIQFSPDSSLLAASGANALRSVSDGRTISTGTDVFEAPLRFHPDGTSAIDDKEDEYTIRLWDINTGALQQTLKGHAAYINSIDFNRDGTILVSRSADKMIKFWHVPDGEEIFTLQENFGGVGDVKLNSLNLDDVLLQGCRWLHNYLLMGTDIADEDRSLCNDILCRNSEEPSSCNKEINITIWKNLGRIYGLQAGAGTVNRDEKYAQMKDAFSNALHLLMDDAETTIETWTEMGYLYRQIGYSDIISPFYLVSLLDASNKDNTIIPSLLSLSETSKSLWNEGRISTLLNYFLVGNITDIWSTIANNPNS